MQGPARRNKTCRNAGGRYQVSIALNRPQDLRHRKERSVRGRPIDHGMAFAPCLRQRCIFVAVFITAFEQRIDGQNKITGKFVKHACRHPVRSGFVLLQLLVTDPQGLGHFSKRDPGLRPEPAHIGPHHEVRCNCLAVRPLLYPLRHRPPQIEKPDATSLPCPPQ
jgi:hypothetical protein